MGHQHVGVGVAAFARRDFSHIWQIAHAIQTSAEAGLLVTAALNNMCREVGDVESRLLRQSAFARYWAEVCYSMPAFHAALIPALFSQYAGERYAASL